MVRNSIPDAPGGGGIEATISLYVNGTFVRKLTLSSRNSWLYGNTDDPEALTNTPQADARRLFDESHALLAQSYPAGTRFKLQRDAGDNGVVLHHRPDRPGAGGAAGEPAGRLHLDHRRTARCRTTGIDDTAAIQRAVTDDQNGVISCVWIPAGQWRQEQKILTDDPLNRGPVQPGGHPQRRRSAAPACGTRSSTPLTEPQNVVGGINHPHEGNFGFDIDDNTQISDIAIFGIGRSAAGRQRRGRRRPQRPVRHGTPRSATCGSSTPTSAPGSAATTTTSPTCGDPGDGLEFTGMRIRNTYADGINFTNGTRNSRVFNSSFRTTGDDSLAVWANPYVKDQAVDIAPRQPLRQQHRSSCPGGPTASRSTAATATRSRTT